MTASRELPSALRRLLLAGWVLCASLLLLEGALQLGAYLARPEATPPAATSTDDSLTVLAVGDSWVAGAEADPGEGFVDRLSERLPTVLGREVRVVNRGRSGANSAYVAITVLDEAEELGADLILVLVGQNNSTNFARVAEVEQRLAEPDAEPAGPRMEVRTLKLARIVWANLRGTEGYSEQIPDPEPPLPSVPPMQRDVEDAPVLNEPLLDSPAGQAYLQRAVLEPVPPEQTADRPAWEVLFAAAARREVSPDALAALEADTVNEVLASYAGLRAAREAGDWRGVLTHGEALADVLPRGALSDLGAAEAALLKGEWRAARALLVSASHRAPGFADVQDLACRFPPEASDIDVQEACEFTPWAETPTALDEARVADGTLDPAAGAAARGRWLDDAPWDLESRVDQALWLAHTGDLAGADEVMGSLADPSLPLPPPVRPSPAHWRYFVSRNAELGDPSVALRSAEQALSATAQTDQDAGLLGAIASVLAEYERCEQLPGVTERWYRARGDALGAAQALGRCVPPDAVASTLTSWRTAWDPSPTPSSFEALARAGNRPLALLERDLDLVLAEASRIGAVVLLLDYPNPSPDHAALSRLISEYATSRAAHSVPVRDGFAARLDPAQWRDHLGPNGHCNGRGYALMADLIAPHVAPLLRSTP